MNEKFNCAHLGRDRDTVINFRVPKIVEFNDFWVTISLSETLLYGVTYVEDYVQWNRQKRCWWGNRLATTILTLPATFLYSNKTKKGNCVAQFRNLIEYAEHILESMDLFERRKESFSLSVHKTFERKFITFPEEQFFFAETWCFAQKRCLRNIEWRVEYMNDLFFGCQKVSIVSFSYEVNNSNLVFIRFLQAVSGQHKGIRSVPLARWPPLTTKFKPCTFLKYSSGWRRNYIDWILMFQLNFMLSNYFSSNNYL